MSRSREQYPSHVETAIAAAMTSQRNFLRDRYENPEKWKPDLELPISKGRIAQSKGMNKLEKDYAERLWVRQAAGEVLWYKFEALNLRLADNTFYRPDFFVMLKDLSLEVHEVKGHWEDDARVKIKVAAALFPFRFIAVTRDKSGWKFEVFNE